MNLSFKRLIGKGIIPKNQKVSKRKYICLIQNVAKEEQLAVLVDNKQGEKYNRRKNQKEIEVLEEETKFNVKT